MHNWSKFPVVLESANVETIFALLESREDDTPCEELNEFSFDVLRSAFDELCCVDRIVVDVLKSVGDDCDDDGLETRCAPLRTERSLLLRDAVLAALLRRVPGGG